MDIPLTEATGGLLKVFVDIPPVTKALLMDVVLLAEGQRHIVVFSGE